MILKSLALGVTLVIGYRSWQAQAALASRQQLERAGCQRRVGRSSVVTQAASGSARAVIGRTAMFRRVSRAETLSAGTALVLACAGLWVPALGVGCVPFVLYASKRYFVASWQQLRRGKIDVETLLAFSVLGSLLTGRFVIASLIRVLTQFSQSLIESITNDSRRQLGDIFAEVPDRVWLLVDGVEVATPIQEIRPGDLLVIHAGETIPVDGVIVSGLAGIDERMLTGEATPVEKTGGDEVYALTTLLTGYITLRVEQAGADTNAARIAGIMAQTVEYRTDTMLRAEAFSRQLVNPAVLASAMAWLVVGPVGAVAVLLAHPRYRLSLTTPISLLKYLQFASRSGILVKDGRSLEMLRQVDTLVFDKTGTLTVDEPQVGPIHCFHGHHEDSVLSLAAAAEHRQSHPLARAILSEAHARGLVIPGVEHREYRPGEGLQIRLDGERLLVGSERLLASAGITLAPAQQTLLTEARAAGHVPVLVARGEDLIGMIELLPTLRPEAQTTLRQLRRCRGIRQICIISGDAEEPTRRLAETLGVDRYFARVLPEQKAEIVAALQAEGRLVCFVGDGINDAIALKQAQVSVSLTGASRIATDTAQIVLLDGGIGHLPRLLHAAQALDRHMNIQLGSAVAVSVCAVAGVFTAGWGIAQVVVLNEFSMFGKLGYSLLDRPRVHGTGQGGPARRRLAKVRKDSPAAADTTAAYAGRNPPADSISPDNPESPSPWPRPEILFGTPTNSFKTKSAYSCTFGKPRLSSPESPP